MTHKVGPKGQVVIPKAIRDELGIVPGDEVLFVLVDGEARLRRAGDVHSLRGILADSDVDLAAELLEERRRDRERDERKFREQSRRTR